MPGQVPQQNRKNLVRRDERAVAVHRADAVAVAIRAQPGVILAGEHRAAQRLDVRLDGLGIDAAKQRIARAANFIAGDAVPRHQLAQQSARRAVHRVHDKPEFRGADSLPVHKFVDGFQIRRKNVERLNVVRLRRQRRHAVRQHRGKFLFHLRDDRRQRRASVAGLEFHAVPFVGIVARGDHDPARRAALPHQQRKRRRRARLLRDPHRHPGHRDDFRRGARRSAPSRSACRTRPARPRWVFPRAPRTAQSRTPPCAHSQT